jgi:hypothetical protein
MPFEVVHRAMPVADTTLGKVRVVERARLGKDRYRIEPTRDDPQRPS